MKNILPTIGRICVALFNLVRTHVKRVFCSHRYAWKSTRSLKNKELQKYIVRGYHYECVKCGKELHVNMDEEHQYELEFEYNSK